MEPKVDHNSIDYAEFVLKEISAKYLPDEKGTKAFQKTLDFVEVSF